MRDPKEEALYQATLSPCTKRKVGACITDANGTVLGVGFNHSTSGKACEDAAGATQADVIHAEVAAINSLRGTYIPLSLTIYTTHAPCANCRLAIEEAGIGEIVVVETFMKFDTDKLRFDLVPYTWAEGDAEVLTGGAKKYKPNNWKEVDDLGRYVAALERHLLWVKKALATKNYALLYDDETGLHHMKHLRTNAGFLLTLTENLKNEN